MQTLWSILNVTNQLSEGFFVVFTLPTLRLCVVKEFSMLCLGQFLFFSEVDSCRGCGQVEEAAGGTH